MGAREKACQTPKIKPDTEKQVNRPVFEARNCLVVLLRESCKIQKNHDGNIKILSRFIENKAGSKQNIYPDSENSRFKD